MTLKIAINGYGRIGRCILRSIYEYGLEKEFKIIAINDLGSPEINVHLTKYDTTHGKLRENITLINNTMIVKNDNIKILSEKNPINLPWKELDIDVVFECTGIFISKKKCKQHLLAGAKKVLISAPAEKDVDATIVYGVNHKILSYKMNVISNASCTTNCLSPIVKIINENLGLDKGLMTTIHSYTNDQSIVDNFHTDVRRARAAASNLIPTKTGAASAIDLVLPTLKGKLDGFAIRVPTINVSIVDLTCTVKKQTTVEEINYIFKKSSQNSMKNVIDYNCEKLVSTDFNHNPYPSIFDATQTRIIGKLIKIIAWYDNEWGFSNQMLRTTREWFKINK